MKKRVIHVSDLKLNYDFAIPLSQFSRVQQLESYMAARFTDFLEDQSNQQTDVMILTGDFFDSLNSGIGEIEAAGELLQKFPSIRFIIAPPETEKHDDSWYTIMEWPSNVSVIYTGEHYIDDSLQILFYYGDLDESLREHPYRKMRFLTTFDNSVMQNVDLYSGLISSPNYFQLNQIYSPGSFVPLDFYAEAKNGYMEILIDEYGAEVRFVESAHLALKKYEIIVEPHMQLSDLIEITKQGIRFDEEFTYYKVIYKGNINREIPLDFHNMIKDSLSGQAKGEFVNNTNKDYFIQEIVNQNTDNLIGLFIQDVRTQKIDDEDKQNIIEYGLDYLL